jgi:UPF0716 family protein affecting phage T7 exclusion
VWAYFAGLLAHCVLVSVIDIALIVMVGRLYGVPFPSHWLAIMLTLVLGAASFCALGVAACCSRTPRVKPGSRIGPAGSTYQVRLILLSSAWSIVP